MTPSPDTLMNSEAGDFVGAFKTPSKDGTPVAVAAIYKGKTPEDVGDVDIYKIRPVTGMEDELTIASPAELTLAVEHAHEEADGHMHADVGIVASGAEAADSPASAVFEDPSQLKNLLALLTQEDHPDVLDLKPENTNFSPESARQALGFTATTTAPDILTLDLQANQEPAATA